MHILRLCQFLLLECTAGMLLSLVRLELDCADISSTNNIAKDESTLFPALDEDEQKQTSTSDIVIGSTVAALTVLFITAAVFVYVYNRKGKKAFSPFFLRSENCNPL